MEDRQRHAKCRIAGELPCQGRGRGFESLRPLQNFLCPARTHRQSDGSTTSRRSAALLFYVHSFTTAGLRDSRSPIVKIFILGRGAQWYETIGCKIVRSRGGGDHGSENCSAVG